MADHRLADHRGYWYDPFDPEGTDIDLEFTAHVLAQTPRYKGMSEVWHSVAEHAVFVSEIVCKLGGTIEQQLQGLHHDDPEAYLFDMPSPVKWLPQMAAYRKLEDRWYFRVMAHYQLPWRFDDLVKEADAIALVTEAKRRHGDPQWARDLHTDEIKPESGCLFERPFTWTEAKNIYLAQHQYLEQQRDA